MKNFFMKLTILIALLIITTLVMWLGKPHQHEDKQGYEQLNNRIVADALLSEQWQPDDVYGSTKMQIARIK